MPQRILVVEDDPDTAALLSVLLGAEGYDVRIVTTLAEARAALPTTPPALVVLDVVLPDGDGLTLCPELRRRLPQVPVLAVTARVDAATRTAAVAAGCAAFIPKPFDLDVVVAQVRGVIGPP